jgi:hypothetical protein
LGVLVQRQTGGAWPDEIEYQRRRFTARDGRRNFAAQPALARGKAIFEQAAIELLAIAIGAERHKQSRRIRRRPHRNDVKALQPIVSDFTRQHLIERFCNLVAQSLEVVKFFFMDAICLKKVAGVNAIVVMHFVAVRQ